MRPAVLGLPVFGSVPFPASLVDYRFLSRCSIGPKVGAPPLRVGLPFWVGALGSGSRGGAHTCPTSIC